MIIFQVLDAGTYTCIATNSMGHDSASTKLRIHAKNVHLLHKGVATNFITVTWNGTNSTLRTSSYLILYRRQGSKQDYGIIHLRPYMRTYTITNLKPETMYEFCIALDHAAEIIKLNCINIKTKHQMLMVPVMTPLSNYSVVIALSTTVGFMVLTCVGVIVLRKWRRRKSYCDPGGANTRTLGSGGGDIGPSTSGPSNIEEAKRVDNLSQIPLDNLYNLPSTPLCTSKTSLIGNSNA